MANDVTIDELQIEIEAESGSAATNLDNLAQSIDRLQAATSRITTGNDGLNKLQKQIEKLNAISQRIQSMSGFERIGQIAEQFRPLESLNASGLNGFIRSLNRLSGVDLSQLDLQIRQISTALEPLIRQAERGGAGLTALAQIMRSTNRTAQQSTGGFSLFNQTIGNIKVKTLAAIAGLRKLFSVLKSGVTASAAYVENLNLFNVTMGKSAGEALKFAEAVNSALGVDTSDWIRYQGVFQSIAKGFGIVSEKADVMSKNLTQLTYDISSFYNISADTAAEKLQSAISGQVMPMRQLGFAIEETTLKQVALNHGIKTSVENMTQAQKAQLRYIAIMEQAGDIGVLGDMARTIDTAANGLRVLQARLQQFSRAIGNMVMPALSAVLPYATAFVQVITEGIQSIANFFGFELPQIDFSGASISSGYDDITASVDEATKATEKFKGSLAGVDQLNIIGSHNESGNGDNAGQFDLGIELPEYDFLQGVESKTKQIAENIKNWFKEALPWIEAVGTAIAGAFAASKISAFTNGIKTIFSLFGNDIGTDKLKGFSKTLGTIVGGLAAGATSGMLFYNSLKNLIAGTGNFKNNIAQLAAGIVVAGGAIAAFIATSNPLGAVITGIVAGVGALVGVMQGFAEKTDKANKAMMDSFLYNNGGTKISEVASAFEKWASAAKKVNDEIINKYSRLNQYDAKMGELRDTMTEIAGVDLRLDEITPADAAALKEPFNELCDYLKTDFAERVNLAAQSVADAFKNLNLGESLNAEMQAAYKALQRETDASLTESQKLVDEYLEKISNGSKLTTNEMEAFTRNYNYIFDMSATKDESLINLEKTLDEIDLSKIDLEHEDYGVESIERIKTATEGYAQSALDRYKAEMTNIAEMRRQLEVMYKNKDITGLTDEDYRSRMDLLDMSENLYGMNLDTQLTDVQNKVAKITGTINQQLYNGSKNTQADLRDWFGELFNWDWGNMQAYAQSRVLDNSKTYSAIQELESTSRNWTTEIEIHNVYRDETTAQQWAVFLKEKTPDVEIEIGRIKDETGQWKYVVGSQQSLIDAKVIQIKSDDGNWQIITGSKPAQIIAEVVARTAPQGPSQGILEMNTKVDWYAASGVQSDQYNWAKKAGDWIYKGLQDGLSKEQYSAYMSEVADIGAQAFCAKYGIHSPSKLFESYGDYMMKGLTIGLDKGQNGVLSSINDTAAEMERHMTGIGFDVPIAMDNSRLKAAVEKAQESLLRAQNISLSNEDFGGYTAHTSSLPKLPDMGSHTTWKSNGTSDSPGEMEATITIYNQIDMDGDTVAEKVNDINARLLYRNNGR